MSCWNIMNKNGLRYESWLSVIQLCPEPCSENDPFLSSVLLFPINLCLVFKLCFLFNLFQLSLLCLFDPQMPSYFFSKARPLFLSFAKPFKNATSLHMVSFLPFFSIQCFFLLPPHPTPTFFFPSLCNSQSIEWECWIVFNSPQGTYS